MIPFVAGGGMLMALGFALGGIYVFDCPGSFAEALFVAGKAGMALMLPILSGFIAFSIADRPGLAPGMVGGGFAAGTFFSGQFLAHPLASGVGGFLAAIFTGYITGYSALGIRKIKIQKNVDKILDSLKPVILIPVFSMAIVALIYIFVLGKPFIALNNGLYN